MYTERSIPFAQIVAVQSEQNPTRTAANLPSGAPFASVITVPYDGLQPENNNELQLQNNQSDHSDHSDQNDQSDQDITIIQQQMRRHMQRHIRHQMRQELRRQRIDRQNREIGYRRRRRRSRSRSQFYDKEPLVFTLCTIL